MEPPRSPKTFSVSKLFSARKSAGNARKEALRAKRERRKEEATHSDLIAREAQSVAGTLGRRDQNQHWHGVDCCRKA